MTESAPEPIFFVEDDAHLREATAQTLRLAGHDVRAFAGPMQALEAVAVLRPQAVVTDIRMPGMDGRTFAARLLELDPDLPIIFITGHGDVQQAVEAMKHGAHDFLTKPFGAERLLDSLAAALQRRAAARKAQRLRVGAQDEETFLELCGSSPAILVARERIRRLAALDRDVLLVGEPGAGKYAAARTIHACGRRRAAPFISFDCAGEPAAVAALLFGDGVTDVRRRSALAAADGGTLYLENLHRLESGAQERLLRALETGSLPWGDSPNADFTVRVIVAFPDDAAAASGVRGDLYWRLAAHAITLPPLRDREADAAEMFTQAFIDARVRARLPAASIPTFVFDELASRTWPGNAPELIAFAERCALDPQDVSDTAAPRSLHERMDSIENALLRETLEAVGGDVRKAIEALRIPRKTFYDKITRHGINLDAYRERRTP